MQCTDRNIIVNIIVSGAHRSFELLVGTLYTTIIFLKPLFRVYEILTITFLTFNHCETTIMVIQPFAQYDRNLQEHHTEHKPWYRNVLSS